MTVAGALAGASSFLGTRLDAELLLAHVLDASRSSIVARDERVLTPEEQGALAALVARRLAGEPLAYLTGEKEFWSLPIEVTPAVLVPRPETELLVEWALELPSSRRKPAGVTSRESPALAPDAAGPSVLDLGTGSGAIALALARELPTALITATDFSSAALDLAKRNAVHLGVSNVEFRSGSWFKALDAGFRRHDGFDIVVSNPPYIADGDPHLRDLRFEPGLALTSGADGLNAIREIVRDGPPYLEASGWLLLEHGAEQGAAVRELFRAAGFRNVETRRDLAGLERATGGSKL